MRRRRLLRAKPGVLGRRHARKIERSCQARGGIPLSFGWVQYIRFGRTGLTVSRLCIGTANFGIQCDEFKSHAILDAAADAGISFLDTADAYPLDGDVVSAGLTEEIVGRWLKGRRQHFIVATKCEARVGPDPWDRGTSRKHILDAIEASLRRLQTDYVDLYQLHNPDPFAPIDETLEALDALVRSGKARYIGCSNFLAYQIARALGRSEARNLAKFSSVQPRYNLLFRQVERELLPLCREEGLAVLPYNPLAGGLLTGRHSQTSQPGPGRFALAHYRKRYWHEREFATLDQLLSIAKEVEQPLPTIAVGWILANPEVTSVILGASEAEHLLPTTAAIDRPLDADLKNRLDELTYTYRLGDAPR